MTLPRATLPAFLAAAALGLPAAGPHPPDHQEVAMFRGVYTVSYHVPDIATARAWYARAFGVEPYFDEPFYVGFEIGGYELGLQPEDGEERAGSGGVTAFWGVERIEDGVERLLDAGATLAGEIQDVGGGVKVATVLDPFGNRIGVIENPHFGAASPTPTSP